MKKRKVSLGTKLKRKATNSAKQSLYMMMYGEKAPGNKRKA